jgi:non-heme chloroperoxidase
VVHGTSDATVPIDVSGRPSAALIPNAELLEYEGGPHCLLATIPDTVNADLLKFLRR